jgi:hypothetical protein
MQLKTDDAKAEVLYVRDEVRKMQGLYNPEKDQALKNFDKFQTSLGDPLAEQIHRIQRELDDKVVSVLLVLSWCSAALRHLRGTWAGVMAPPTMSLSSWPR